MEKDYLEGEILKAIAITTPYSFYEVVKVHRRCKSYELTRKVLEESTSKGISCFVRLMEIGL